MTAAELLRTAIRRGVAIPRGELVRLLDDDAAREAAIDAAGVSTSQPVRQTLVPLLRGHLDIADLRGRAAIALGRMQATACTEDLLGRLPDLRGLQHEAFVVALELMGDPAAIGGLRERLADAPAEQVWGLHNALVRLCGWEPLTPLEADQDGWAAAVRHAWHNWNPAEPARPRVEHVEMLDPARAQFVVRDGQARIGIGYDPPRPGSPWPRWDKSLRVAGQPIYGVGSDCGTCETSLRLLGWLGGLRTGHYLAVLVDLELEHVTDPAGCWWWRRLGRRGEDDGWHDGETPAGQWPGTDHFQLRTPIPGPRPTYAVALPTRPLDTTSTGTVATHAHAIAAGTRPAALLLTWVEDRYVRAEHPERFLVSVVLDGHHKLLAYTRQQTPARALMVCRIEDSWGPPDDRTQWINETTQRLRHQP